MAPLDFSLPYSEDKVEIRLPITTRTPGVPTDFRSIRDMRSFLLTAANHILNNFLREHIEFYHLLALSGNGKMSNPMSSDWMDARRNALLARKQFLASLSTMITHILGDPSASVSLCERCFVSFAAGLANIPGAIANKTYTAQITDFLCDNESRRAFDAFAVRMVAAGNIQSESPSFSSLLTKFETEGGNLVDDWRLLIWTWVHQVFATAGTLRHAAVHYTRNFYYFVSTLVFVPFVQLPCSNCSEHAVHSMLWDAFQSQYSLLEKSSQEVDDVWDQYGYFLHQHVNLSVRFLKREHSRDISFTYDKFRETLSPFLLRRPLSKFVGTARRGECTFKQKWAKLAPFGVTTLPTFSHADKFFNAEPEKVVSRHNGVSQK